MNYRIIVHELEMSYTIYHHLFDFTDYVWHATISIIAIDVTAKVAIIGATTTYDQSPRWGPLAVSFTNKDIRRIGMLNFIPGRIRNII